MNATLNHRPILKQMAHLQAKEESEVLSLESKVESVCAWCQKLYGWPIKPNQSPGICAEHEAQMRAEIEQLHQMR